jgi:hypothetical protein
MIRFILITLTAISFFSTNAICQKVVPFGMEVGFGKGYNIYGSSTNKYFDNAFPVTPKLYFYFYDVFFGFDLNDYDSPCKRDIILKDKAYTTEDKMALSFGSFIFGYTFYYKKNISFDPYLGFITTGIQSLTDNEVKYNKTGFCGGLVVNKFFILKNKNIRPLVFLNSRLNYNKLGQLNNGLGNYNFTFDIGLGIEFGQKLNKKITKDKGK